VERMRSVFNSCNRISSLAGDQAFLRRFITVASSSSLSLGGHPPRVQAMPFAADRCRFGAFLSSGNFGGPTLPARGFASTPLSDQSRGAGILIARGLTADPYWHAFEPAKPTNKWSVIQ
jgi:hypothetical protein